VNLVTQTITTKEEGGNCFAACLASIFELPLDEVPNAALIWRLDDEDAGARGHKLIDDWLAEVGLAKAGLDVGDCHDWRPEGNWIGSYDSPRLPGETHAVVCRGYDGVAWDPHPNAAADPVGESTLRFVYWLYVLDPALFARGRELRAREPEAVSPSRRAESSDA